PPPVQISLSLGPMPSCSLLAPYVTPPPPLGYRLQRLRAIGANPRPCECYVTRRGGAVMRGGGIVHSIYKARLAGTAGRLRSSVRCLLCAPRGNTC
ncbi:hypothetical protein IscW_ISCW001066, partial [Ixodes scapularis]